LILEHRGQSAVLFGTYPEVAIGPAREVSQFLDFGMGVCFVVFDGEPGGVVDADVAAEAEEDACDFVGE